jgi:hypothetical protein
MFHVEQFRQVVGERGVTDEILGCAKLVEMEVVGRHSNWAEWASLVHFIIYF